MRWRPAERATAPAGRGLRCRLALGLWCLALLLACGLEARADEQPYYLRIEGEMPKQLAALLERVSQLKALESRVPVSRAALERRVQRDLELLGQALRSEGYYEAQIAWHIEEGSPLAVVLQVETGRLFTIGKFDVVYPSGAPAAPDPPLQALGIALGQPATATAVIDAEARLVSFLQNNGYPLAEARQRHVTVDLGTGEMQVTLAAEPGPEARFGALTIEGLDRLEEDYFRRVLQWPAGEIWSSATLESIRRRAVGTNLFDSVALVPEAAPRPDGTLPATLEVQERKLRSVGLGIGYSTEYGEYDQGFSLEGFWEHRNLLGEAERLRFDVTVSLPLSFASASFRKPAFIDLEQSLLLNAELRREDIDAYSELSFLVFGGIERPLYPRLTLSTGLSLEALQTDSKDEGLQTGNELFLIAGLPTALVWDNRDDPFNPTRGVLASLGVTPAAATVDRSFFYLLSDASASTYYAPFADDSVVLAVRGRLASIMGPTLFELPASKRLYAGGGGSVRGYEIDSLGARDADGDAIGGRSLFEASAEARFRFLEDYGLVLFLDAGQVYEGTFPEFTEPALGAGVGLRYYTSIGPIRLDVAVPLNPRDDDPSFQFYVSIGQAF